MDAIDRAAALAKLRLSDDEKSKAAEDLKKMLEYFEILKSADLSHAPEAEETVDALRLREDKAVSCDVSETIVPEAPQSADKMFVVPETI